MACEKPEENLSLPQFDYFSASTCEVHWKIGSQTEQNVVFVVAGLDLGGMWHLVFDDLMTNKLSLRSHFGTKYTKLEVLAVGEGGVVDKIMVSLPEGYGEGCGGEVGEASEKSEKPNYETVLLVVSFVVLFGSILVLFLSLCLYRKYKKSETLKIVTI